MRHSGARRSSGTAADGDGHFLRVLSPFFIRPSGSSKFGSGLIFRGANGGCDPWMDLSEGHLRGVVLCSAQWKNTNILAPPPAKIAGWTGLRPNIVTTVPEVDMEGRAGCDRNRAAQGKPPRPQPGTASRLFHVASPRIPPATALLLTLLHSTRTESFALHRMLCARIRRIRRALQSDRWRPAAANGQQTASVPSRPEAGDR
ncbi:hypothetical protein CPLU01_13795 [Colletotrichum plurivorum]|uniref:Uncharacterized protein n=1 Tax=Colletotrichum plurivorum TaxID=2175906 RepID=A0A8H6N1B5_9PEZI|nr:hypothetical protein CPLU01_13795 [Colletotrichum plurivorum]